MNDTIEKFKGEFIDNTRAASHSRLIMKKHKALVDLIKSVEPELRQRLQKIWARLEDEEATLVQTEISAFANYDGMKEVGDSVLGRALYASLSPGIGQERVPGRKSSLNQQMCESAVAHPAAISSSSVPSQVSRAVSTSAPRSSEPVLIGLPESVRDERRGRKRSSPTLSIGLSESSGDINEEIEARPKKRGFDLSTTLSDRAQSGSPIEQPQSSSSSSRTLTEPTSGPSSSNRAGLHRTGKPQGSYNEKAKFRELGLGRQV